MKKVLGPFISIMAGILAIVILCIDYLVVKAEGMFGGETRYNAWDLAKNADKDINGSIFFKVMTIIIVVIAAIMIIYGLIYLLSNLKVLKIKGDLKIIGVILLIVLLVAVILQLIALLQIAKEFTVDAMIEKSTAYPTVGMWTNLGFSIGACLAFIFFTKPIKKRKK